jgi:hypothetical protein
MPVSAFSHTHALFPLLGTARHYPFTYHIRSLPMFLSSPVSRSSSPPPLPSSSTAHRRTHSHDHSDGHVCGFCASAVAPPLSRPAISLAPQAITRIHDTLFGKLQTVAIETLPPRSIAVEIRHASKATRERQTASDTQVAARLTKRLEDLENVLQFFQKNANCEFLGFAGWGEDCSVQLPANAGMSQYHMVLYRNNEGQIVAEEIGSSYTIFESNSKRTTSNEAHSHHGSSHGHVHSEACHHGHAHHDTTDVIDPITNNGCCYDLTVPTTVEGMTNWGRTVDDLVHRTMFQEEAPDSLKTEWGTLFTGNPTLLSRFSATHKFFHYFGQENLGEKSDVPESSLLTPSYADHFLRILEYKLSRMFQIFRRLSEVESQREAFLSLKAAFEKIDDPTTRKRLGLS